MYIIYKPYATDLTHQIILIPRKFILLPLNLLLHHGILHKNVVNLPCPALDLLHFSCVRDNLTKLFCSVFRLSGYATIMDSISNIE